MTFTFDPMILRQFYKPYKGQLKKNNKAKIISRGILAVNSLESKIAFKNKSQYSNVSLLKLT